MNILKYNNKFSLKRLIAFWCVFSIVFFITCKTLKPDEQIIDFVIPNVDILEGTGFCELKKFQGTSIHNKFYLSWLVVSNSNNYFFLIEASKTGKKYYPCYYIEGNISPANNAKLLFCYTDSLSSNEKMFYRIKAIPFNKTISSQNKSTNSASGYIPTIMIKKNCKSLQYSLLN